MPASPPREGRAQVDSVSVTVLFIGQDIQGQGQLTPGEHGDQTLAAKRTDQTIEGHGGEMVEDSAQFQTEAAVGRQQGIAGHVWSQLTITQDEVRSLNSHSPRFSGRPMSLR